MSDDSDEQSEQPRRPITIRALGAVGALPWRQMVGAFVAVAAPLALVVAAITLTNVIYASLLAIAFVVGMAAIPLAALTVGREETVSEWAKRTPKPGETAPQAPIIRAGEPTFVPDIDDGDVVIPLAEPLSRLRDVAGVGEGYESEAAGIEEFGGDTGGFSGRAMLGGTLLFTLLGIVLGWVLFL